MKLSKFRIMVQYKVLILAIVAIMSLVSLSSLKNKERIMSNCCHTLILYGNYDSLIISDSSYAFTENEFEIGLHFKEKEVVKKIEKLECKRIKFCINDKIFTAKSNPVFSSGVPENTDCFFPVNTDGSLVALKENSTIYMRKIKK